MHIFLMGSSCWADVPTAMPSPSKAVITAVREEYMIFGWNKCLDPSKASRWVFRLQARATNDDDDDDSRLGRRHEGLKQEGKRR